jgi:hypothetical protein
VRDCECDKDTLFMWLGGLAWARNGVRGNVCIGTAERLGRRLRCGSRKWVVAYLFHCHLHINMLNARQRPHEDAPASSPSALSDQLLRLSSTEKQLRLDRPCDASSRFPPAAPYSCWPVCFAVAWPAIVFVCAARSPVVSPDPTPWAA